MRKHRSVLPVVIPIVPPHQVRQGEGLVRAAGPGTFRPGGQGGGDFPGNLPDGGAVLRQIGLLRPEWVNKILPRCPTTSVSGKICGAELS